MTGISPKGGFPMATNEKEINNYLFDQLSQIERIRRAIKRGGIEEAEATMSDIEKEINRKLYQKPPA